MKRRQKSWYQRAGRTQQWPAQSMVRRRLQSQRFIWAIAQPQSLSQGEQGRVRRSFRDRQAWAGLALRGARSDK